jgi:hypothetical protein
VSTLARIDKTDSAIGVFRAALADDIESTSIDKVIAVGLDASGHVVPGDGVTGIVGVLVPVKGTISAGQIVDVLTNGEVVEVDQVTFGAGDLVYASKADGILQTAATNTSLGTVTFTDSGDVVTVSAAHGLVIGDRVIVGTVSTTTGITAGTTYWVKTVPSTTTLTLSDTEDLAATLALTTNGTSTAIYKDVATDAKLIGFTVEADRLVVRHGIS